MAAMTRSSRNPFSKDFERETGIKVRAVYDTEETKSAGAMNQLIAEKNNPQADVYWAGTRSAYCRLRWLADRCRQDSGNQCLRFERGGILHFLCASRRQPALLNPDGDQALRLVLAPTAAVNIR